ncbi:hypothetical protein CE91St62_13260 [Lachnospiraceae bacterium]|nr:hypothetical protein CE91St61_13360 [Lachnospiraceae bacterium]BDF37265.1 hypothetical protein CE91St62_13260 [Lachnospiraceae bacterium]
MQSLLSMNKIAEDYNMKKSLKPLLLALLCIMLAAGSTGCGRDFDASGYVKGVLDLNFQGQTEKALEMIDGSTAESLKAQYKEFIDTFVANNITNEIDMGDLKTSQFAELVSKIFSVMRYSVGEADKTGKKEYEVPVEIRPSDVFIRFQQLLTEDSLKIAQDVKDGVYKGTDEEVQQQILSDIINHAYELLDVASSEMEFQDAKTVIVKVKADKRNEYSIDGDDMDNLVIKILRLDEIQG